MSQLNQYYEHGRSYERWIAEQKAADIVPKLVTFLTIGLACAVSFYAGYLTGHPHS